MSLLDSFSKKSKLKSAIKQTRAARKSEGNKADQLFNRAYEDFAQAVEKDLLLAEALYNWGFALLNHAQTKTGEEAVKLFQDAIEKFNFCSTIAPNYLAAAIDCGVAFMDLARIKSASANDPLYERAKEQFNKANSIQAGTASYNLACIYGLRRDEDRCREALEDSRDHGVLPGEEDILNDPDLQNVKYYLWFSDFMESLKPQPEPEPEEEVDSEAESTEQQAEATVEDVVPEPAQSDTVAEEVKPVDQPVQVEEKTESVVIAETAQESSTNDASVAATEKPLSETEESTKPGGNFM